MRLMANFFMVEQIMIFFTERIFGAAPVFFVLSWVVAQQAGCRARSLLTPGLRRDTVTERHRKCPGRFRLAVEGG
jgi:hypothetical protein